MMKIPNPIKIRSLIGVMTIMALLGIVWFGASLRADTDENRSETYRQLQLFGDIFERVRADYVRDVTDEELVAAAIKGMLSELDPHSSYLDPKSYGDMQVQTRGEFGGLGIEVTMENGFVKVVSPIDDTPAFRAGVQAGDYITHLNGDQVLGLSLAQAVERMRGKIDTNISLTIRREGEKAFDVSITRAVIKIRSVRHRAEENVGYVRITTFNEQTQTGLLKAIESLEEELDDKMIGMVLDLRNNPGGLLDQAISVSDSFLNQGEIVSTRGREIKEGKRFNARPGEIAKDLPLVVLINGGSASASEIVAGALQDHGRAIILGTRSFGKGSVQTIIPFSGHGAIRLTTAQYFTPSGRSIQQKGIEPDIMVEQATLETISAQRRRREENLRGSLQNPNESSDDNAVARPDKEPSTKDQEDEKKKDIESKNGTQKEDTQKESEASSKKSDGDDGTKIADKPEDYQLSRAIDLIRGLSLYNQRISN